MKKKPLVLDPNAAFPDQLGPPTDEDLPAALGPAYPVIAEVLQELGATCPQSTSTWQYSRQAGWYRLAVLKQRRLFYLIPKRGAFELTLILGGKAIASLKSAPHAKAIARHLKTATRYPEGTAFRFNETNVDPGVIADLLRAKLAY